MACSFQAMQGAYLSTERSQKNGKVKSFSVTPTPGHLIVRSVSRRLQACPMLKSLALSAPLDQLCNRVERLPERTMLLATLRHFSRLKKGRRLTSKRVPLFNDHCVCVFRKDQLSAARTSYLFDFIQKQMSSHLKSKCAMLLTAQLKELVECFDSSYKEDISKDQDTIKNLDRFI
ncbi:hypothetical protein SELMODRAFT_421125 [Selaginella moellendorffii]|uniref:Uncharacterized protein n=1 Tax=Selaginella moellendorffii TaxID=88036 RepID=D8SEK8_SELML|nr:hypothetical protein SELMODRAFT_421125 [Selaginella moellendorffii]